MASICDFTASDGSVSRSQAVSGIAAYNNGKLDRSAAVELISAYNDGSGIERCGSDDPLEVDPSLVSITGCSITSPQNINVGETVTLTAEVANGNNRAVRASIGFRSTITAVDTTTVAAGRKGRASVEIQFDDPGTYEFDTFINSVVPL
jgi:hypothetical protein